MLFGLCWTEAATCSMVTCCLVVDFPGDLLSSTVPKLRNLLTHFCTNLLPGASFSCRCFKLKFDRNRRLVSCSDVAKMHVSTQNVFSLIFHIALHQVHWQLFCHLLHYLCAKNHKFGTCRLSAQDDNLGVFLSGPPCISKSDRTLPSRNLWPFNWAVTRAYVQYPRSTSALSHIHPCTRSTVCRCVFRYSQEFVRYLKCFGLCFFPFLVPVPLGPAVITHHAGTKTALVSVLHHSDV